jgi:hypothetical protein
VLDQLGFGARIVSCRDGYTALRLVPYRIGVV